MATASALGLRLAAVACSSDDAPASTRDTAAESSTQVALDTADRFLAAMADEDIDAIADSVAADVVVVHPFTFDGSQDQQVRFEGEDAILGYVETVFSNFATIAWRDEEVHVTDDGATVFIEVKGDSRWPATARHTTMPTSYASTSATARSCGPPSTTTR